jgi:RHS repeat-associated protein
MKEGSRYYFYQTDHLGTPVQLMAPNGTVVWSAVYESFGEAAVDPGSTVENNLRFPGQYYDEETGSHYNWHRYYDPRIGRYSNVDPVGFAGGDVNLYGYGENDPVNAVDPLGLFGDGQKRTGDTHAPIGHSDFTGNENDLFDYTKEDYGWTNPYVPWSTSRHFRNRFSVELDLWLDLRSCNKSSFERHMHQGQDSFSHYDKGYKPWMLHDVHPKHWDPGHAFAGHGPDKDKIAWDKAEEWTKTWVIRWVNDCERKCDGKWVRK